METADLDGRESVLRRTDEFIAALKATPVVRRYAEAARRFQEDQEVQSLMRTLQRFQRAPQAGEGLSTELQDARDAHARLRNHPVVEEYLAARDAVGALLRETNLLISQILGLDFGQTAGSGGCACQ
jgi:cell fate (sporulation/competence/biofilm development) regulator YlbF (YheA/YmcA/DUF963 family)